MCSLYTVQQRWGYCIQLNKEAGLLYIDKQGGMVYGIQLEQETGLANLSGSTLQGSRLQAINIQGETAMVDVFCIHY